MTSTPFADAAYFVTDAVRAATVAAWPRSSVRYEIARLREEGYRDGEACEFAFSVSLPDAASAANALPAIRRAGYDFDASESQRGFVTARTTVLLRALDLARTLTRLERAVRANGGFVEVIGPTRPATEERMGATVLFEAVRSY